MNLRILAVACLLSACTSTLPPNELSKWVEAPENGCAAEETLGDYSLKASVLPANLMAYKQLRILEEAVTDSAFRALEKEYLKGRYFKFSIDFSRHADKAKEFLQTHSDYLNFYIAQDLHLVVGTDTIMCSVANLERSASFSPSLNYELAFDTEDHTLADKDLVLLYRGGLSEGKPVTFPFFSDNLNDIPNLKR